MKEQQDLSRISDWQMNALQWMEACYEATRERDEARRERDEARMWICRFDAESRSKYARRCGMSDYDYTPLQMARERGWDCFKEKP